jgi:hypothetical protein
LASDGYPMATLDAHDVHLIYLPVDPKWDPFDSTGGSKLVRDLGFMAEDSAGRH